MSGYPPPPPFQGGQPPHPGGFGPQPGQSSSKATTSLILGILGIFCCALLSPVAIYFASEANKEFAYNPMLTGQGNAKAGKILGIIGCVLWGLGIAVYVLAFVIFAASDVSTSSY